MIDSSGNTTDIAERFENALHNTARGWRHAMDRRLAGLLMREPSISDRRVNRIVITHAGHRFYAQIKDEASAVRQRLLASITLESLAHLTELLEQLQCILQRYHDGAPVRPNYHETLDWVWQRNGRHGDHTLLHVDKVDYARWRFTRSTPHLHCRGG